MRRILAVTAFAMLALVPVSGRADPCSGAAPFNDVNAADIFCTNVVWLANRGITTGCGGGAFCPLSDVTRAQMALFMNRLAVVLTPTVLTQIGELGGVDTSTGPVLCDTGDVGTGNYPKIVWATSTLNAFDPSAGIDIRARIVYSVNAGTTWTPFNSSPRWSTYQTLYPGASPVNDVTTTQITPNITIPSNVSIRFGVQAIRETGAGTVGLWCALRVTLENSNATVVLFDPHPESVEATPGGKAKR